MISTKLFQENRLAGKDLVNEWRAEFWIRLFFIQQFILAFPPLKKLIIIEVLFSTIMSFSLIFVRFKLFQVLINMALQLTKPNPISDILNPVQLKVLSNSVIHFIKDCC